MKSYVTDINLWLPSYFAIEFYCPAGEVVVWGKLESKFKYGLFSAINQLRDMFRSANLPVKNSSHVVVLSSVDIFCAFLAQDSLRFLLVAYLEWFKCHVCIYFLHTWEFQQISPRLRLNLASRIPQSRKKIEYSQAKFVNPNKRFFRVDGELKDEWLHIIYFFLNSYSMHRINESTKRYLLGAFIKLAKITRFCRKFNRLLKCLNIVRYRHLIAFKISNKKMPNAAFLRGVVKLMFAMINC